MLCQWYLTKLVGEIFLGTTDACDTSESVIPVIPVSQVIPVIPVSQVIPVIPVSQVQVRLSHLWVDFRVICLEILCLEVGVVFPRVFKGSVAPKIHDLVFHLPRIARHLGTGQSRVQACYWEQSPSAPCLCQSREGEAQADVATGWSAAAAEVCWIQQASYSKN